MSDVVIDPITVDSSYYLCTVVLEGTESLLGDAHDRRVPPWIPASQRYYWSSQWQREELASLQDIKNGDVHRFGNSMDAIRWLLSDDNEQ